MLSEACLWKVGRWRKDLEHIKAIKIFVSWGLLLLNYRVANMEILTEHRIYIDECVQFYQTYVPSHVLPWVPHTDSLGVKTLSKEVAGSAVSKGANICVKVWRSM